MYEPVHRRAGRIATNAVLRHRRNVCPSGVRAKLQRTRTPDVVWSRTTSVAPRRAMRLMPLNWRAIRQAVAIASRARATRTPR